jgi:hypothetical protein
MKPRTTFKDASGRLTLEQVNSMTLTAMMTMMFPAAVYHFHARNEINRLKPNVSSTTVLVYDIGRKFP